MNPMNTLKNLWRRKPSHRAPADIDLEHPWRQAFSPLVTKLDVYYFFRHILGRQPQPTEWPGHCELVGKNLEDALGIYLNSPEFKARNLVGFTPSGIGHRDIADGFVIHAPENDLIGGHILATGDYEPAVSRLFRELVRPGMTVVDIGANIGWYALLAASLTGPTGRVFAIEPGVLNGRLLLLNKAANHFQHLEILHIAASDRVESVSYSSSMTNGFVTPMADASVLRHQLPDAITQALPIDLVIPAEQPVHLIKVDVEGWEYKALLGAARIIEQWRPQIIAEFTPPALQDSSGVSGAQFLEHFRNLGYHFTIIGEPGNTDRGQDIERVMRSYQAAGSSHIDMLMTPT